MGYRIIFEHSWNDFISMYTSRFLPLLRSLPDIPAVLVCVFIISLTMPSLTALAGDKHTFMEICTLNGTATISVEHGNDMPKQDIPLLGHIHDCPLCHFQSALSKTPPPRDNEERFSFTLIKELSDSHSIYHNCDDTDFKAHQHLGHNFFRTGPPSGFDIQI